MWSKWFLGKKGENKNNQLEKRASLLNDIIKGHVLMGLKDTLKFHIQDENSIK